MDHKTSPICTECWQGILPHNDPGCQRCGKPFVSGISTTCAECIQSEPAFESARSFGSYSGTLKKAVNLFKYHGIKRLAGPLSDIMHRISIPSVDAVIPVPLYKKRLRQREFNQSALLAKRISEHLGIPLILDCLIKVSDTTPQVGMNSKDRFKNVKKAFIIKDSSVIRDRNILLVDDVFTTGATVRECSGILKKAGARNVYVITLAHGVMN
jgi:ComF family protein